MSVHKFKFQEEHSFDKRSSEAAEIREKYPDRIPVIVERATHSKVQEVDKKKYLVPSDITVGQFVYVIRKRIQLGSEQALYLYVNGILPPTSAPLSEIYQQQKDTDGFLYMTYAGESTYGSPF